MPPLEDQERTTAHPSRSRLRLSPGKSLASVLPYREINSCAGIKEGEKDQRFLFKLETNYHTPKTQRKRCHLHAQRSKIGGTLTMGATLSIYRGYGGFSWWKKTGLGPVRFFSFFIFFFLSLSPEDRDPRQNVSHKFEFQELGCSACKMTKPQPADKTSVTESEVTLSQG